VRSFSDRHSTPSFKIYSGCAQLRIEQSFRERTRISHLHFPAINFPAHLPSPVDRQVFMTQVKAHANLLPFNPAD
jgi:hypothetical protein